LTKPRYPKCAIGIEKETIAAVALEGEGRGRFHLRQAATVEVPARLITPSFLEKNIASQREFQAILEEAVTSAGLLNEKRWSVSLPSAAARTAIITLDSEPASRQEAEEILEWKSEQSFGAPAGEMRIMRQRMKPERDRRIRYFASAIRLAVIDEYETAFESLGWKAGLVLPRSVSEANWLLGENGTSDSLLISSQSDGFSAILFRGREPAIVRTVTCTQAECDDEIYRLLMYYNDRLAENASGNLLERLLLIGRSLDIARIKQVTAEAYGRALRILGPEDLGLDLAGTGMGFDEIAAPAGLAALGAR
jgi:hypothetical protein